MLANLPAPLGEGLFAGYLRDRFNSPIPIFDLIFLSAFRYTSTPHLQHTLDRFVEAPNPSSIAVLGEMAN